LENIAPAVVLNKWRLACHQAFRWRDELNVAQKLGLALAMAIATGLLAQVKVPLPWTPVPLTLQTLTVLMSGVLLGRNWGGISQALYVGLGVAGVPWFIGWQGGFAHLAGPTGGYLIGFILAAWLTGYVTDKYQTSRRLPVIFGILAFASLALIYIPGLLQLGLWMNMAGGKTVGIGQLLNMGLTPFIAGEVIKIGLAGVIAWGIMPERGYNE
jgi:biotin transport system substrate-specific component